MNGTVLIAGAGLAGSRCAESLRALGWSGRIVVAGDEPHAPYERPALSKELLAGGAPMSAFARRRSGRSRRSSSCSAAVSPRRSAAEHRARRRRDDRLGRARARDRASARAGSPGRPASTTCARSTTRARCAPTSRHSRVVVVGAGFIGGEVASTLSGMSFGDRRRTGCDAARARARPRGRQLLAARLRAPTESTCGWARRRRVRGAATIEALRLERRDRPGRCGRRRNRQCRRADRGRRVRPHFDAGVYRVRRRRRLVAPSQGRDTYGSSTGRVRPARHVQLPRRSPASRPTTSPVLLVGPVRPPPAARRPRRPWDAVCSTATRTRSPRATSTRRPLLSALAGNRATDLRSLRLELAA